MDNQSETQTMASDLPDHLSSHGAPGSDPQPAAPPGGTAGSEMDNQSETQTMASDLPDHLSSHGTPGSDPQPAAPPGGTGCSWLVAAAAWTASLSGLILGYELGLISGVLLQLRGPLRLTCRGQELLVSSLLVGALLVSLGGGFLLDRYGRRRSMLLAAALVAGGTAALTAAGSLAVLALGRAVVGAGAALSGMAACLYVAEIAPRERRGLLVTLYELMVVLGVFLGFALGHGLSGRPNGWRYTFGLALPVAALQAGALLLLPPSPRFLVARGDTERARAVLARLRGGRASGGGEDSVEAELKDIQAGLREEAEHSFRELFGKEANLCWRLLTGAALVFLQQATGQPNLLSYASPLLRSVGFHSDSAATLASTGFGVVKVLGTVPAVLLVDRLGPKSFLCVGAVFMGLSLTVLGTVTLQSHTQLTSLCQSPSGPNASRDSNGTLSGLGYDAVATPFYGRGGWNSSGGSSAAEEARTAWAVAALGGDGDGGDDDDDDGMGAVVGGTGAVEEVSLSLKWVSLISLLVYVAAFSFSLGPMVYVVVSEIFPTSIRGKAVSVVSAVNWATNLLISMTFLTVTEKIGVPNVMFLYAAMSFVLLVFVILCVPETRGRTLEQISKELAKKKPLEVRFCRRVRPQETLITSKPTEISASP